MRSLDPKAGNLSFTMKGILDGTVPKVGHHQQGDVFSMNILLWVDCVVGYC